MCLSFHPPSWLSRLLSRDTYLYVSVYIHTFTSPLFQSSLPSAPLCIHPTHPPCRFSRSRAFFLFPHPIPPHTSLAILTHTGCRFRGGLLHQEGFRCHRYPQGTACDCAVLHVCGDLMSCGVNQKMVDPTRLLRRHPFSIFSRVFTAPVVWCRHIGSSALISLSKMLYAGACVIIMRICLCHLSAASRMTY